MVSAPENIRNIPSAATAGGGPYADRFATFQVADGEQPSYREWQRRDEPLAEFVARVIDEVNGSGGYVHCTGIWTCTVEKDATAMAMAGIQ